MKREGWSGITMFAVSRAERVKGIRKIPLRGGILANAIAYHPTPSLLPTKGKFESPRPSRGGGVAFVPIRQTYYGGGVI